MFARFALTKSFALALAAASFLAFGSSVDAQVTVGGGTVTGGGTTTTPSGPPQQAGCSHRGVEWVDPKVSSVGPTICDVGISVNIGINGIGGTIEWSSDSCPAWIVVVPGHNKPVHKVGYDVVNPQQVPYEKRNFKCVDCGIFGWFTCCEADGSEQSNNYVTTYEEFPCSWDIAVSTTSKGGTEYVMH